MKRILLLLSFITSSLLIFAQPVVDVDKIDVALANNGANGSNSGTAATFEIAFRTTVVYPAVPAAEDMIIYLRAPQSVLTGAETISIIEKSNIFGSGTVDYQGKADIGTNTYFFFVLNAPAGLNLSLLTQNAWKFAFTFQISPAPSAANRQQFKLIDRTNNAEITTANGGLPTYTRLLVTNINQLTGAAFSLLPVTLTDFNVSKQGATNAFLTWTTSFEQNVSHFELERSNNENSNWKKFAEVTAKGNSTTPTSYSFTDLNVYDGNLASKVVFYRIRSIDLDGKEKIFPVRTVRFSSLGGKGIGIYPNPAKDGFTVTIPLPGPTPPNNKLKLNLVNQAGQLIHVREISAAVANNYYYDIKTPGVIPGEYMLQVIMDGELLETKKIIIQR